MVEKPEFTDPPHSTEAFHVAPQEKLEYPGKIEGRNFSQKFPTAIEEKLHLITTLVTTIIKFFQRVLEKYLGQKVNRPITEEISSPQVLSEKEQVRNVAEKYFGTISIATLREIPTKEKLVAKLQVEKSRLQNESNALWSRSLEVSNQLKWLLDLKNNYESYKKEYNELIEKSNSMIDHLKSYLPGATALSNVEEDLGICIQEIRKAISSPFSSELSLNSNELIELNQTIASAYDELSEIQDEIFHLNSSMEILHNAINEVAPEKMSQAQPEAVHVESVEDTKEELKMTPQMQMIDDLTTHVDPDVVRLWEMILSRFPNEEVIKSWTLAADGSFTIELTKPIFLGTSIKYSKMGMKLIGDCLVSIFGDTKDKIINGKLITQESKTGMEFSSGVEGFARLGVSAAWSASARNKVSSLVLEGDEISLKIKGISLGINSEDFLKAVKNSVVLISDDYQSFLERR